MDQLWGLGGKDIMTPGAGNDVISYNFASESTSTDYDVVVGFNFKGDHFDFSHDQVTSIVQAVSTGTLSTASFDSDLHDDLQNANNGSHTAVLFTPDAGSLAGHMFLVVDRDGLVGYTAGEDYVIELASATHFNHMTLSNFGVTNGGPP